MADPSEHFQREYKEGIDHLLQQQDSRLRNAVTIETVSGEVAFFDQLGATAMTQATTRNADTSYTAADYQRRMVALADYDVAELVDKPDRIRQLNDPTNSISQSQAMAANRTFDDIIIAAALGTASTGKLGAGTQTANAPPTGLNDVDITTVLMALIKRTMDEDEVPDEDRHIIMPASQYEELLTDTQFQSSDFNTIKALVHGEVGTWMGFEFHRSERLATDGSSKQCFAWHKSGIVLAIGQDTVGRITEMPGKRYAMQVFYSLSAGAVRMEENKVVRADLLTA